MPDRSYPSLERSVAASLLVAPSLQLMLDACSCLRAYVSVQLQAETKRFDQQLQLLGRSFGSGSCVEAFLKQNL